MSVRSFVIPFLAVLWLWPAVSQGQSPELNDAYNRAGELYAQGRYQEAIPFVEKALRLSEREFGPDHLGVATALIRLALVYSAQGKYAEAEPLLKRALAIDEKARGPDHRGNATVLNRLALVYRAQGKYAEAEPLYKRVVATREKALGPDHPQVARSINNLALFYQAQGRYDDAEPLYKRVVAIFEKALNTALNTKHPFAGLLKFEYRAILENYAALLRKTGRRTEAAKMESRAKAILDKHAK